MQLYLPIAELSVNALLILGLGGAVGFLSGMFGVGGGFLMTPLLIFAGIPPAVAVASVANQLVASSVSGALVYWRRGGIDVKMGIVLLMGGTVGSFIGLWIFRLVRELGQVDLLISLSYVVFLDVIGALMLVESVRAILRNRRGETTSGRRSNRNSWMRNLPIRVRFRKSRLYISVIPPLLIGTLIGIMAAVLGVGGGFIMVPAMIYILRMPTNVVVGTSLFQIIFVTGLVTVLHAVENQAVDIVLALLLLIGGVIGAQFGARTGQNLRGEQLRLLLALLVLAVAIRLLIGLVVRPDELFEIIAVAGNGQ